jgi:GH43 family beta-xylosidase
VVFRRDGRWYFLGTNDNLDDIGLYAREADSVEGLFAPGIVEHLILPFDPSRGLEQTFWAPEFHLIGGEAWILFAVSGHAWGPQCHMMRLKKGGRVICAEDWEDPVPVVRRDGSPLSGDGITLDMTYIPADSGTYVVWSYRRHIGTPRDTGSMLYIAAVDEREPWRLTSEPVLLTRPLYGWENVAGTINNEGPHALIRDGRVYLAYSGGSANAYTYALGLLTVDGADDLLDPAAWHKSTTPVLTFRSVAGEYGPGHHSFFVNDQGETMIAYHAETGIREHLRCDGIRRVHFRADGTPYFQMSPEEDLPERLRRVTAEMVVP